MTTEIIDYKPEYFLKLNEFWIETGLGGSYRGDTAEIINGTINSGGHLLMMINSETKEIIGTSWLTNDNRRTYLHHFGIREKYRRQGLARQLLNYSLQIAYNDGFQVKLEVHKDNIAAINLYQQFGFKYLGDYEVLIKRELPSIE